MNTNLDFKIQIYYHNQIIQIFCFKIILIFTAPNGQQKSSA